MAHPRISIIGVGNIILQDEGVGVFMSAYLEQNFDFTPQINFHHIGTGGLALADVVASEQSVILLDTIIAEEPPGTIVTLDHAALTAPEVLQSPAGHGLGLQAGLEFANRSGVLPHKLTLIAMVPGAIGFGEFFSQAVDDALPKYQRTILDELQLQGVVHGPCVTENDENDTVSGITDTSSGRQEKATPIVGCSSRS